MKNLALCFAIILLLSGGYYAWQGTTRLLAPEPATEDLAVLPLPERLVSLAQQRESWRADLITQPANPYAWTNLAETTLFTQGPQVAAPFYDLARQTGLFEPSLLTSQALLALRMGKLDDTIINLAFQYKRKELVAQVQQSNTLKFRLAQALADQPEQAKRLAQMLRHK